MSSFVSFLTNNNLYNCGIIDCFWLDYLFEFWWNIVVVTLWRLVRPASVRTNCTCHSTWTCNYPASPWKWTADNWPYSCWSGSRTPTALTKHTITQNKYWNELKSRSELLFLCNLLVEILIQIHISLLYVHFHGQPPIEPIIRIKHIPLHRLIIIELINIILPSPRPSSSGTAGLSRFPCCAAEYSVQKCSWKSRIHVGAVGGSCWVLRVRFSGGLISL